MNTEQGLNPVFSSFNKQVYDVVLMRMRNDFNLILDKRWKKLIFIIADKRESYLDRLLTRPHFNYET